MNSGINSSIFIIGIGNAGCQILSNFEKKSDFNSVYISSSLEDIPQSSKGLSLKVDMKVGGSISIPMIRSLCKTQIDELSQYINSADCVIVACNPGEKICRISSFYFWLGNSRGGCNRSKEFSKYVPQFICSATGKQGKDGIY